jgi:hypothetical protein
MTFADDVHRKSSGLLSPIVLFYSLAALAVALVWVVAMPQLLAPIPIDADVSPVITLGNPVYDFPPVDAPAASGGLLEALAAVFCAPSLGPLVTRGLLNQNGVWKLRELARQVPEHVVQRPVPLHRISDEEWAAHQLLAQQPATQTALAASELLGATRARSEPVHTARQEYWGIEDFAKAYKHGKTDPVAVAKAVLAAIPHAERALGRIFMQISSKDVEVEAAESARRWRKGAPRSIFDGVPVAVKDMITVRGFHMRDGSSVRRNHGQTRATSDDPIVTRLRAAGAVIIGTTTMTEFGVTPLGWSAHWRGPRNPHNRSHYPGGSSAGSAVAVAAGLVPLAIGFDGGGSIRIPAALSGTFGLACGYGRVRFGGSFGAESSMVHAGGSTLLSRCACNCLGTATQSVSLSVCLSVCLSHL